MTYRRGTSPAAALVAGVLALSGLSLAASAAAAEEPAPSADIQRILDEDDTAVLHDSGQLYYVDPAPAPPAGGADQPQRPQAGIARAAVALPALSSRPLSPHTIFLDFDGGTLPADSAWTEGSGAVTAGPYSGFTLDASSTEFSAAEATYIEKMWRIVAEKFSAFDVNVTTVDPGQAALTRSNAADTAYGVQMAVTNDPRTVSQACDDQCAGIAFSDLFDGRQTGNVFNNQKYTLGWVFSSQTYGSAQMTALTAAHEIGHTLGLAHDGGPEDPNYYDGHNHWTPVMGLANQRAVFQFSKGEYAGANNTEDDLAIIGRNGPSGTAGSFTLADDYPGNPTPLGAQASYTVNGVIGSASDTDVFSISRTCTSPLAVETTGIGSGQSLDIKLDVTDPNGAVVTNNPASSQNTNQPGDIGYLPTGMNAAATLPSTTVGTYRVAIDGVGTGNPFTGYSDYGSIGSYQLSISGCGSSSGSAPGAPTSVAATVPSRATSATVTWQAPGSTGSSPITSYQIIGLPGGTIETGTTATSRTVTGLTPGLSYTVSVRARNADGLSDPATSTLAVPTWVPQTAPGVTVSSSGVVQWTKPANPGNADQVGWNLKLFRGTTQLADRTYDDALTGATISGLTAGTYEVRVVGVYDSPDQVGLATARKTFALVTKPGAPRIGNATPGAVKGAKNATARWAAPISNGGAAITSYRVVASKVVGGKVTRTTTSKALSGAARSFVFALPAGSYKFRVLAYNSAGASAYSAYSRVVVSR